MNHKFLLCLFAFPIATISAMEKPSSNNVVTKSITNSKKLERHKTHKPHCCGCGNYFIQCQMIQQQINTGAVSPYAPF